jgi:hypothetical protein
MSKPNIIGLYSSVPQSGKSTVANYLCHHHGYIRVPFAATLKDMAAVLMRDLGIIDTHEYLQDKKHIMLSDMTDIDPGLRENLRFTVRHICQTLGTEWGRDCLHPAIWTTVWQAKVNRMIRSGIQVVVDDLRFPNEYDHLRANGAEVWFVKRPSISVDQSVVNHASEGRLDDCAFDCHIYNTSTLEAMYNTVESIIQSTRPLVAI